MNKATAEEKMTEAQNALYEVLEVLEKVRDEAGDGEQSGDARVAILCVNEAIEALA